jgi:hypothetical protein
VRACVRGCVCGGVWGCVGHKYEKVWNYDPSFVAKKKKEKKREEARKLQDYDQHDIKFNGLDGGVSKKIKKLINLRKLKKITEKIEPWKKLIKPNRIFKKPTGSVSVL